MAQRADSPAAGLPPRWIPIAQEPDHPLAALDGREFAGARVAVALGRSSRFGARYFALYLTAGGAALSREPVLSGLHMSGPLRTYNWIEVAETRDRITLADGRAVEVDATLLQQLFGMLYDFLPSGGHIMVEYDSPQRAATARELAHNVPAIATPLGAMLYRAGFGAHFKDWQIAEGGSEGPRKLQAYKSPSQADTERWKRGAIDQVEAFLAPGGSREVVDARQRAEALLGELRR